MNEISKQQTLIHKILWGALCFSNLVLFYLVTSGMVGGDGSGLSRELLYGFMFAGLAAGSVAITLHNSTKNLEKLREQFKGLNADATKLQLNPQMQGQYQALSEHDKKLLQLQGQIFVKSILAMALCESINVFGLVATQMGMSTQNYYYFFIVAIGLLLSMFPRYEDLLRNIR